MKVAGSAFRTNGRGLARRIAQATPRMDIEGFRGGASAVQREGHRSDGHRVENLGVETAAVWPRGITGRRFGFFLLPSEGLSAPERPPPPRLAGRTGLRPSAEAENLGQVAAAPLREMRDEGPSTLRPAGPALVGGPLWRR